MFITAKYSHLLLSGFFLLSSINILANPLDRYSLTDSNLLGKARLSVLFWDVYDARLYVAGSTYDPDMLFALSLRYLRGFEGIDIAERSIDEIRQQGFDDEAKLASWQRSLELIFPNVTEGDEIVGISSPNEGVTFYFNGSLIGTIENMTLSKKFFDIWLSEKTSEPEMRKSLLGHHVP